MAKPLDPKKIESARQFSSRAERREQRRKLMKDEIAEKSAQATGVIVNSTKKVAGSAARAPQTPCCGVLPRQHTGRRTGWQF